MAQTKVNTESLLSNPTTLLSLYTLDGTAIGLPDILYFHDGSNNNFQPITFNGQQYLPFPVEVEGFELDGKGQLPRPKVTIANINGFVSSLLLQHQQLINAKITRTRVYARFIDAINFPSSINPFGTPDPTAIVGEDVFYINRKISENKQVVQFELATILEIEGVKLPNRPILGIVCPFRFRDPETCGYSGVPVADKNNKLFVGGGGTYGFSSLTDQGQYNATTTYNAGDYIYIISVLPQTAGDKLFFVCNVNGTVGNNNGPILNPNLWLADACAYNLAGCKLHFPNQALRFGGFPGVNRADFSITA